MNYLIFGSVFNQIIDKHTLPDSIISLTFGNNFNQQLNYLPKNLLLLIMNNKYEINNDGFYIVKYNIPIHSNTNNNQLYEDFLKNEYEIIQKIFHIVLHKKNLLGNIIKEELIKKIYHPNRLIHICERFNMDIHDLLDIY